MKQKLLHIWIFFCLWGTDDPWMDGARIDASFAWGLAGIFAEYDDELSQWEELKGA
jgi:hypothetical protein